MSSEPESDIETSVPTTAAVTASPSKVTSKSLLAFLDEKAKTHPVLLEILKDMPLPSTYKGIFLTEEAKKAKKAAKESAKPEEKKTKETEPVVMVNGNKLVKPTELKFEVWCMQNSSPELLAMTKKDRETLFKKYKEENKEKLNVELKKAFDEYDKAQQEHSEWAKNPNKTYNKETHRWNTVKPKSEKKKTETPAVTA